MSKDDPLASATLAALYIGQGHRRQAQRVLSEVLSDDPFDGHALALRDRLALQSESSLSCSVDAGVISLRWQRVPLIPKYHVILLRYPQVGPDSSDAAPHVTSTICGTTHGDWQTEAQTEAGAVASCVATVRDEGLHIIAVADVRVWP